jgi:hypothetical protein
MVGSSQKKRKGDKSMPYDKQGKRMRSRYERETAVANEFFFIPEMFIMELLLHCDLFSIFALAKTCKLPARLVIISLMASRPGQYARDLVKSFFATNLRLLVAFFVSDQHVKKFYEVLEISGSAIAGSVTSSVLAFPYRHSWNPLNLNIIIPRGHMFMWEEFLTHIGLAPIAKQLGVDRKFQHTTFSHVVYSSKSAVRGLSRFFFSAFFFF